MKMLSIKPVLDYYASCKEFAEALQINEKDLIITNEYIYQPFFGSMNLKATVLYQEKYGMGEPSDEMAEKIYADMKDGGFKRIIAIGGGTIIDISKLYALKNVSPILDLFDRKLEIVKDKQLILVPTTCGTGSEVTNISILELKSRHTKMGLATDELYADSAVMIPELLNGLPFKFFATSSVDALIHAYESYLSPKSSPYTELFAREAIDLIIRGYKKIAAEGEDARKPLLKSFLIASNYAGIAFGNAGVGAVHAMSYPLGGTYHVPHGEANYALFVGVCKAYQKGNPNGKIKEVNKIICDILGCKEDVVYEELEKLLNKILQRKPLREYGVTKADLDAFTDNVMTKQGRLTANNYVPLDAAAVKAIYESLY
ncbi:NAD-dependent 4-hydroxybutyrate dehydrogenase [uncultured delta proteobacterium]|uniref:NAD-dependent 4-hydroxybutyrate dehydrogenase n=1 Tax=uncultured delta proteobacterium TaxID=34034 RepID=A0A212JIF4_9DELT|nr:NAD-dependent 4-hydroxybutyrate dehydrogenase [uncultured delta proteobacterium]